MALNGDQTINIKVRLNDSEVQLQSMKERRHDNVKAVGSGAATLPWPDPLDTPPSAPCGFRSLLTLKRRSPFFFLPPLLDAG